MKKTLLILMILALAALIISACSSDKTPETSAFTNGTTSDPIAKDSDTSFPEETKTAKESESSPLYTTGEILPADKGTIESGIYWPDGQVIPWFASADQTLYSFKTNQFKDDELLSVVSLQGIVNRTKPRILVLDSGAGEGEGTWAQTLDSIQKNVTEAKKYSVLKDFASEASGVVIYSTSKSSHYANLASTIAGTLNAIPMTGSVYEKWKSNGIELDVLEDITELSFTKETDIYNYLYEHYWDKCNHRLVISLSPTNFYNLHDLGTAVSCATLFLDCTVSDQKKVFEKFLEDMEPGNGLVLGWYTTERSGISTVASHGLSTVPADFFNNATVYAGTSHNIKYSVVPTLPKLEHKVYVMIVVSDGDNIQYNQHAMRQKWDASLSTRGKTAINWTISPSLVDIAPNMLNYYYRTATKKDCLICGPSGLGYSLVVNTLREPGAAADNFMKDSNKFTKYVELTNRYLEKAGLRAVTIWDCATDEQLGIYTSKADYLWGLTVHYWGDSKKDLTKVVNEKLVQQVIPCYCSSMDQAYSLILNQARTASKNTPAFLAIQLSVWGDFTPAKVTEMEEKLKSKYEGIEFLRADHFYALYNEANGLTYNLALSPDLTIKASSSQSKTKYIVDGRPTNYIWEAGSQGPQTIEFSLGDKFDLSKIVLYHAESAGKSVSLNTKKYKIEVSEDGINYTEVYNAVDNKDAKNTIALSSENTAFIRLTIEDPGNDWIARISEIEIYGKKSNK